MNGELGETAPAAWVRAISGLRPRCRDFRLSLITFQLFFGLGATGPVLSLYLQDRLHFTGAQTGLVLSMSAFSALVSPAVCSTLADRVISAERLFSLLLLLGGALMAVLYRTESFFWFLILFLLHSSTVGATTSLSNAIIFHRLADRREYGRIRVWGTLGWIAVAWVFGWAWLRGRGGVPVPGRLGDALLLSALSMVGLGLYALTLRPTVELKKHEKPEFLPRGALGVLRDPKVIWLALIAMGTSVTDRIYTYSAAIFLKQCGVSEPNVLPMLSLGQVPEIFAMLFLGRLTARLGLVPVMLWGALANAARYGFFLLGPSRVTLVAGVLMHGLAYAFFFSTVFILLDGLAKKESRAGVHQLFGLVYGGAGGLLGSWIAGALMDACRLADRTIRFGWLWSVPFGLAIAVSIALLWGLRRRVPGLPAPVPS